MKGMSRTYLKDDVGNIYIYIYIYTFNVKACMKSVWPFVAKLLCSR